MQYTGTMHQLDLASRAGWLCVCRLGQALLFTGLSAPAGLVVDAHANTDRSAVPVVERGQAVASASPS